MTRFSLPRLAACLVACGLAGCAAVGVDEAADAVPAQRPTRIILRDFAVDPDAVRLDEDALGGVARARSAGGADEFRATDAATARDMVATTLVFRLKQLGFTVERAPPTETAAGAALVIDGRLDRVEEGDRARRRDDPDQGRALVAGRVEVRAVRGDGAPLEIAAFTEGSDAHRPRGLPGATAAEAAALAVGGIRARELLRASISAESRRLGNAFADQIKGVLAQKGWLPDGA